MGTSQSQERIAAFEKDYIKEPKSNHPYFGNHFLLVNRTEKKLIICKQMAFKFSAESKQFLTEYQKVQRKPFNIIYPSLIIKNDGLQTCSSIYEMSVYYDLVGKNLTQVVKTEGLFSENKAWFLLNEISKALQILSESYRPHWAICPENIYQNEYQNYFIFDSLFVIGVDPQSFLMKKLENGDLMSEKMQVLLEKGFTISPAEGFEEDCYCLGFVLLFVLTGIHFKSLPKEHLQRSDAVKAILYERKGLISSEMIEVILQLIERETLRRMDNYQLRRFLKDKQAEIIRNEEFDYEKSRRKQGETQRQKPQPIPQRLNLSKAHLQSPAPASYSHVENHNNSEQCRIISNRNSEYRIIAQNHQSTPLPTRQIQHFSPNFISNTISIPPNRQFYEPHHASHNFDAQLVSSDRSNTLTRINSYDRLISKN